MQAAVYDRLGGYSVERQSAAGKLWATATLAVSIDDTDAPLWLQLVPFGRQAEALLRHSKGDLLSVSGHIQRNARTGRATGEKRKQLRLVADAIISAKSVRPSGNRKPTTSPDGEQRPGKPTVEPGLDDPLPF